MNFGNRALIGSYANLPDKIGTGAQLTFSYSELLGSPNSIEVLVGGVLQRSNFTVSGLDLIFDEAPPSGVSIQVKKLGDVYDIGVPSNNVIENAHLTAACVPSSNLAGDSILLQHLGSDFGRYHRSVLTSNFRCPSHNSVYDVGNFTTQAGDLPITHTGDGIRVDVTGRFLINGFFSWWGENTNQYNYNATLYVRVNGEVQQARNVYDRHTAATYVGGSMDIVFPFDLTSGDYLDLAWFWYAYAGSGDGMVIGGNTGINIIQIR